MIYERFFNGFLDTFWVGEKVVFLYGIQGRFVFSKKITKMFVFYLSVQY